MIARDHHRPDARTFGAGDGTVRLVARRVDHPDQAGEHQVALDLFAEAGWCQRSVARGAKRDTKGAERAAGEQLVRRENFVTPAVGQRTPFFTDQFARAPCEQDIGSAFREQQHTPFALGVGVQRAHQLSLGRERHFADARKALLQSLTLEPGLSARRQAELPRSDLPG